jgi:hypothetical protein
LKALRSTLLDKRQVDKWLTKVHSVKLEEVTPARVEELSDDELVGSNTAPASCYAKTEMRILLHILIPRSFDSIEALVAKNFIRFAASEHAKLGDPRPLFATLAVSRDAIRDKTELIEFLNEITVLDEPPQGFYILVAAQNADARTDIYNADVIAAWMLIKAAKGA